MSDIRVQAPDFVATGDGTVTHPDGITQKEAERQAREATEARARAKEK